MSTRVPQKEHAYFDVCSTGEERMFTIKISFMPGQRLWEENKIERYLLYWKVLFPSILSKWLKTNYINSASEVVIYFEILMHLPSTPNENEARRFLNAILTFLSTFSCTKCKIYIHIYELTIWQFLLVGFVLLDL